MLFVWWAALLWLSAHLPAGGGEERSGVTPQSLITEHTTNHLFGFKMRRIFNREFTFYLFGLWVNLTLAGEKGGKVTLLLIRIS